MRFSLRALLAIVLLFAITFAIRNGRVGFARDLRQIGGDCTHVWMGECRVRDVPGIYMKPMPKGKVNFGPNPPDIWANQEVYIRDAGSHSDPSEWNPFSLANWNLSSVTVPIDAIDEPILNRLHNEQELVYLVLTTTDPYNVDRVKVERIREALPKTRVVHPRKFE